MKTVSFILGLFLTQTVSAQQLNLVTNLDSIISETSGLIFFNGRLITHNDSGTEPKLYEVDTINGDILRTVVVANAQNVDWEDITQDNQFIYIGDFGNNDGTRTDLKIYKIDKNDYLTTVNDTVYADTIQFSYLEQTDFTPAPFATNFDAEAMISFEDSLYIFTKNWDNAKSDIYAIPKISGNYSVARIDNIESQGFVTGADYDANSNTVSLIGYTLTSSFLFQIEDFDGVDFTSSEMNRYNLSLPNGYSYQTEGIVYSSSDYLYASSENGQGGNQGLYSLSMSSFVGVELLENDEIIVFPNPVKSKLSISGEFDYVELYDSLGHKILTTKKNTFSVKKLPAGRYSLYIYNKENLSIRPIIKE